MERVRYRKRSNNGYMYNNRRPNNRRRPNNGNVRYKRKLNKKKVLMVFLIFCLIVWSIVKLIKGNDEPVAETSGDELASASETTSTQEENTTNTIVDETETPNPKKIDEWNLILVNYENVLPEGYTLELANIDDNRQFDARAIKYLKNMLNEMRKDGISDIWAQSTYRSVETQKTLYENSINKYLKQGKTEEEAERLTLEYINKPGTSEHNLGLAVDFNYVTNEFEDTPAFKWLKKNAEDYGFILRYPKDKEDITKIEYESWHWRYVGEEHAKKINELDMCLEEYIEYLESQN